MKQQQNFESKLFQYLIVMAIFITISMTPWMNSDSLIIPKLIGLFAFGLSIFPIFIVGLKHFFYSNSSKFLLAICTLILTQLLAIMCISDAPLEQQFFGRTGRGLGFATELALILILLVTTISIRVESTSMLQKGLLISCFITSIYSIFQRFGFDIFDWTSRTNGIIGTLGNPNFQSSFAAMAFIPTLTFFWSKKYGKFLGIISIVPSLVLIYISESTQGYITLLSVIGIYGLYLTWFKSRNVFYILLAIFSMLSTTAILGMLNKGPLSNYLYKVSVQSRGDFFRTSFAIANEHPFFGVGLDSLGDNYLKYWNPKNNSAIGEFADNSHNLFLNYASTGGYVLAVLQYAIVALVLFSFIGILRSKKNLDHKIISIFCAWVAYQLQALISPANISMLTWNAILSGSLLGIYFKITSSNQKGLNTFGIENIKPFMYFLFLIGTLAIYPLYKVDNMFLVANKTGNANLAIQSALSYPESTIRYARVGQELLRSNLLPQALDLGRRAVAFNPNAPSAWALVLLNNSAPLNERIEAKKQILRLDPYNKEIRDVNFPELLNPDS